MFLSYWMIGVISIIVFVLVLGFFLTRTKEQFDELTEHRVIKIVDNLGKFGIVGSVLIFIYGLFSIDSSIENQKIIRIREAWQLLNSSELLEGTRGRKEALEELNDLSADLQYINIEGSVLDGIELNNSKMLSVKFNGARIQKATFMDSTLENTEFICADLRNTNFTDAGFIGSKLKFVLLNDTDLKDADFSNANLEWSDLSNADLDGIKWNDNTSFNNAYLGNVKNVPPGFWEKVNSDGGEYVKRFQEFGDIMESDQIEIYNKWKRDRCQNLQYENYKFNYSLCEDYGKGVKSSV